MSLASEAGAPGKAKRTPAMTARTGAARAVGGACASNPLPLIIPCHRVVRADGNLGGYLGTSPAMLAFKAYLLQLESAA